jgi:hypothetical protein
MTKLAKARNLGPQSGAELESIGIKSLEQLREIGWEDACTRWAERYPARVNLNAFASVIGAIHDLDWREIDPALKDEARRLIQTIREERD